MASMVVVGNLLMWITFTLTEAQAPGQVTNLAATQHGSTLKVTWSEPAIKEGEVTAYIVEHSLAGYGYCQDVPGASLSSPVLAATNHAYVIPENVMCPYCRYNITVIATTTTDQRGNPLTLTNQITAAANPWAAPPTPAISNIGSRDVTFSIQAMACIHRNGPSFSYDYRLIEKSSGKEVRSGKKTLPTTVRLTGLIPYSTYELQVATRNSVGLGPYTNVSVVTKEDVPPAPGIKEVGASLTSISVEVAKPNPTHGIIIKYTLEMWKEGTTGPRNNKDIIPSYPSHTFSNLNDHATYRVRARAWTSKGSGNWSLEISIITVERIPGRPNKITAGKSTTGSVKLIWTPPKYNNGELKNYKAICNPIFSYDPAVNWDKSSYTTESSPSPDVRETTISALQSATEYNCSVAAQTSKGYGPTAWIKIWTNPESIKVPDNLFPDIPLDEISDTTITVDVKKMPKSLKTGLISAIRIGIDNLANSRRKRSTQLTRLEHTQISDYRTAKESGQRFYIAAELNTSYAGFFIIGDGNTYGGYYNPPLETGQKYDVIFGMVITAGGAKNTTYSRYGSEVTVGGGTSSVALAVGITIGCLILLVIIIVTVTVVLRRKQNQNADASGVHTYESPIQMRDTQVASSSDPDDPSSLYDEPGDVGSVQPMDAEYYVIHGGQAAVTYENTRLSSGELDYEIPGMPGAVLSSEGRDNHGMVVD